MPTPLSTDNPNWAVLVEIGRADRLYLVVETKSSLFDDDVRDRESAKVRCGEAHFDALALDQHPARFIKARNIDDLLKQD